VLKLVSCYLVATFFRVTAFHKLFATKLLVGSNDEIDAVLLFVNVFDSSQYADVLFVRLSC
jgi:hypothetical protein